MTVSAHSLVKTRAENATAIKNCLAYLAREAREAGLGELAKVIDVAVLAAADAARENLH